MTHLPERVDTVVIGAGQAGLTMSWHLQRGGRDHLVLDRRTTLGGGWQDRWDGFRLVGPNWTASFPDAPYDGNDPDGYMTRDEIAGRVADYAGRIGAPVLLGVEAQRLTPRDGSLRLETTEGQVEVRQAIVATGGFHVPHVPSIAAALPRRVHSLHSHDYRRPDDLPPGGVLVVGSGQTGVQLVEELRAAGRNVWLCVSSAGRVPRRYRGHDVFWWLWQLAEHGDEVGVRLPRPADLPHPGRRYAGNPALSGHGGGHETDARALGRDGTTLLGRLVAIDGERIRLGDDLEANLEMSDRLFDQRFRVAFDEFAAAAGIDAPATDPPLHTEYRPPKVEELDLADAGIGTVLWTTGYRQQLGWIEPPITDEWGLARQDAGVAEMPGLFFIGSLWQVDQASATLFGMPRDARSLAARLGIAPTP
ncbi:MAG: NAD(P)-binding domain-containing protein [Candidatus Limnocylindria bacterium]